MENIPIKEFEKAICMMVKKANKCKEKDGFFEDNFSIGFYSGVISCLRAMNNIISTSEIPINKIKTTKIERF